MQALKTGVRLVKVDGISSCNLDSAQISYLENRVANVAIARPVWLSAFNQLLVTKYESNGKTKMGGRR
jgi:hypothetical protein